MSLCRLSAVFHPRERPISKTAIRVNYALSICEFLFLALNRFSLVAIVGFFHALLLGLLGLLAGRRSLVFWLLAAHLFAPSMGRAQGIKTPLAAHNSTRHPDKSFCPIFGYEERAGGSVNQSGRFSTLNRLAQNVQSQGRNWINTPPCAIL
jgi:hypothetical protein